MLNSYIIKINKNIEKADFTRLLNYISEEKKQRISRFHRFEDAQRTLLGEVLARYTICLRTGVQNRDLSFGTNEYGKPILLEPNGVHFNISHSGAWVGCAIDEKALGIDIEVIKLIDFNIAERFFTKDEYLALINKPKEMQMKYFYMLWTLKESYIKAEGKGLSIPLNSFGIRLEDRNISAIIEAEENEYRFHQSFLSDDTIYAVCTLNRESYCKTTIFDVEEFIKKADLVL